MDHGQKEIPDSDSDSLLSTHDRESNLQDTQKRASQSHWRNPTTILAGIATLFSLAALCLLVVLLNRQYRNSHHGKVSLNDTLTNTLWKDCGNSSDEARAKGCLFDVLLTTWIHSDCYDGELHEKYLSEHTFPWWRKPTMEDPISLDEVRRGDYYEIYTNLDYHFVHCGYAWEMILRAFRRGKAIEGELWAMGHTLHCVHHMVERPPMEQDRTILNVGFETCGKPYY